jgi:S1-C subfamily serine protease
VPSNMAAAVMNQIVRYGEVRRGRLGVEMVDVTPALAKKLGVSVLEGAVVAGVQSGSPAEKAGLQERDVVVGMNGRPIRSAAELRTRLGLTPVGEEVELRIRRGSDARALRVRVEAPQKLAEGEGQAVSQIPGIRVVEIERGSPLSRRVQGLVVASVEENSKAWQAGLRPGDIIFGANRQRVRTLAELQKALRANDRGHTLNLLRGDSELTIALR